MLQGKKITATCTAVLVMTAIAVTVQPGQAENASAECLSRPSKAPPRGSHWYYRVDRTTGRRCWYLGPERPAERRPSRADRDLAPVASPPPSASPAAEQATMATSEATTAHDNSVTAAGFSAGWPPVLISTASNASDQANAVEGDDADKAATTETPSDMPLVRPVLTEADRAGAEPSSHPAPSIWDLLPFLVTLAAFIGVAFHTMRKLRLWFGGHGEIVLTPNDTSLLAPI